MNSYKLVIVTPEKEIMNSNVVKFTSKNVSGEFEILANFEPFISNTIPTVTTIEDDKGKIHRLFTSSGLIKVRDNEVIFCVDSAEWPEEIDVERAKTAKERAEGRLLEKNSENSEIDVLRAKLALARAITRLQLKN